MEDNSNFYALVMAGGKGTRFWPESTSERPKQYISLLEKKSFLEHTLDRLDKLIAPERRYVVTVKEQEKLAFENSKNKIAKDGLIFEPSGRNTGPCITLSLATLLNRGLGPKDILAILPSDHVIGHLEGFMTTLKNAKKLAIETGGLVTIGIRPTCPHTGYGYIHRGDAKGKGYQVQAFKEKPNTETAIGYLETGDYYWNAGMFVGSIEAFMRELETHAPEMFVHLENLKKSLNSEEQLKKEYEKLPAISVDYAVMEKSQNIWVVPSMFEWSDLGSWDALEGVLEPTKKNTIASSAGHCFIDSKGNIIHCPDKFVALVGVQDMVITCTEKAVLILPKKDAQRVKEVVEYLKSDSLGKTLL